MNDFLCLCASLFFLLSIGCQEEPQDLGNDYGSDFERNERIENLGKELDILKWENSRLALKLKAVDGADLVRHRVTGLWHHDVSREPFTGRAFETHPDGSPKGEASFLKGRQDGISRLWHEGGKRKRESQWFDGRLHGLFREWNESGRLIEEKRFKNGELVEVIVQRSS